MAADDRDLYEAFAAVRREEEAGTPPMRMLSRAASGTSALGRRGRVGRLAALAVCLSAMIAVAVWLMPGPRVRHDGRERDQAAASITTWKPSTDFLLETPGRELLQSVPAVGEWPGTVPAPVRSESHRPLRKQVLQ